MKHNKKRNVGLVYEFLARYLAEAILTNSDTKIAKTKTLLRKHFNKGTDLHKEFRLFKLLHESRVSSHESAVSLIDKVKKTVRLQSQSRLDLEKTSLIHDINSQLNEDQRFFSKTIPDYKTLATIQVLLNRWRTTEETTEVLQESITEVVDLEDKLVQHLTSTREPEPTSVLSMTTDEINGLVVKTMMDKINQKFASVLNETQKKIVQSYAFQDTQSLKTLMTEVRDRTLVLIDKTLATSLPDNDLRQKLQEVNSSLLNNAVITTDEATIAFYLGVSKLEQELLDN